MKREVSARDRHCRERELVVGPQHAIDFAGDGMPAVLCTPCLIWIPEHAARESLLTLLDSGESTVGQHGGCTPKSGGAFRKEILSRGSSRDPMESYKAFRGHESTVEALLVRRGLK